MRNLDEKQIELLQALMPEILNALTVAHDGVCGTNIGARVADRVSISPAQAIENLRKLDLGEVLDEINNWCWCPVDHEPGTECMPPAAAAEVAKKIRYGDVPAPCNLDSNGCTANDGEPCDSCKAALAADEKEARRLYAAASPEEKDPARYARELAEAGRSR
jgi:hypothetical protein